MSQTDPTDKQRSLPWTLVAQGGLVVLGLGVTLAPVPGEAALYLPLRGTNTAHAIDWSSANGAKLLRAGPVQGSLIVAGTGFHETLTALADGALLIAAPDSSCGQLAETRKTTR